MTVQTAYRVSRSVGAGPTDHLHDAPAGYDVVVIGGGPAGCSAARLLARWGLSVCMITRAAPRPHLAESIPPSAGRLLDHMTWRPIVDAAGFIRSTGNTFMWEPGATPANRGRQAFYEPGSLGYQVDRGVFNSVMLRGVAQSGVEIIDAATAIGVNAGVVRYRQESGDGQKWARWVLDCCGRTSVVARLGWRRNVKNLRTLAIAAIWERKDGWPVGDETHTIVESHADGWAWSVPVSRTQRHVTVMLDPGLTSVPAGAELTNTYRTQLQRARGLSDLTRGATLVGEPFARDASPYSAQQVGAPNILLVGDAASFVDPLSSFGIKKAFASAWLAAVVVRTCLADHSMLRPALDLYETRERAMYEALERQRVELAQAALGEAMPSDFWTSRSEGIGEAGSEPNDDIDVALLRQDPEIMAAFADLKRRESLTLQPGGGLEYVHEPAIVDDHIRMQKRLRMPGADRGVRYVRNIDLVELIALAPSVRQVPDLYDGYCQRVAVVPLPDFLGALALLIGRRVLEFA